MTETIAVPLQDFEDILAQLERALDNNADFSWQYGQAALAAGKQHLRRHVAARVARERRSQEEGEPFWRLDFDERDGHLAGLQSAVERRELVCIVDEAVGGIIAYAHGDQNAQTILAALEQSAFLKETV